MPTLLRQGFGLNTDLFETNILNLTVVLVVVIKVVGDSLQTLLEQRRRTILSTLKEVDQKAIEAEEQLKEAQQELEEARLRSEEIRTQTVQSIEKENSLAQRQLEKDLQRLRERRDQIIQLERQRVIQSISKKISDIALTSAENTLLKGFKSKNTSNSKQKELNEIYIQGTFFQLKKSLF